MSIASKVTALLEALRGETFGGMSPVERRHIADLCRYIADKAEPKPEPKAGVIGDLRDGRGRE
jgi:hypothetical protein